MADDAPKWIHCPLLNSIEIAMVGHLPNDPFGPDLTCLLAFVAVNEALFVDDGLLLESPRQTRPNSMKMTRFL